MPRLVGVLLVCLGLGACGESNTEEYKDDFPPIDRGLVALSREVQQGLTEADDRSLATQFGAYTRRLADLRDRLADLEPPDTLSEDHDALLAAMSAVRGALADIAQSARSGDAPAARAAAIRLVREGARLERTRRRLARDLTDL